MRASRRDQVDTRLAGTIFDSLQFCGWLAMTRSVETPSFTFRLDRVRDLRERAEAHAGEELEQVLRFQAPAAQTSASFAAQLSSATAARPASALSASPSVHGTFS